MNKHRAMRPVDTCKVDFPIFNQEINGFPLTYLDSGASAQKPASVIDAISHYYRYDHSNVHRGVHTLSQRATTAFEAAREKVRAFINAPSDKNVIFTRGATDALNIVAYSWLAPRLDDSSVILVSEVEHHSNIVPWQLATMRSGGIIKKIPMLEDGSLDMDAYHDLLDDNVVLVATAHVSNSMGTINPIKSMTEAAHKVGARIVVDGAQAAPHFGLDLVDLDVDFYAIAGHKVYGPTGIGVLYGKEECLLEADPFEGGGDMIKTVTFEGSTWADLPAKFEAGTPSIAQAIGLGAAIDYLNEFGMDAIFAHEQQLMRYLEQAVKDIEGLHRVGTAEPHSGVYSFVLDGIHPHDIGTVLDSRGVAIRTGHHCAQPVMRALNVSSTSRVSLGMYNDEADIDRFVEALGLVKTMFA